ncbi:hypothetical protein [Poseidonibacter lekithochrous]|uniref:hypothetical protein n=1 Tax=Poseidonibacter lekithochrous TaxID=1904463 RepID=UPI000D389AC6|nr:hypothetical protein [Poseidonibacter lekithochrous]
MTTKSNNENFYEIWDLFEKEVIKKFGKNANNEPNFSEFAKFNQKKDKECLAENDYKKVYNKLMNRYKRINNQTIKIQPDTIKKIESYYKILKNDYFVQELLDDESPKHWFD